MLQSLLGLPILRLMKTNPIVGIKILSLLTKSFYAYLNDEKYAEADIFIAFKKIMSLNIKEMYNNNPPPNPVIF